LILGLGKSGFSVAKLLLKLGAKLTLNDKKDLSNDDRAAELDKLGVRVISGYHPVEIFDEEKFDYLVKNPGIPYENPMVEKAEKLDIPVITDLKLHLMSVKHHTFVLLAQMERRLRLCLPKELWIIIYLKMVVMLMQLVISEFQFQK
jgi:UDP-N-acetylmuramoylalanine-D-glutamate ligase